MSPFLNGIASSRTLQTKKLLRYIYTGERIENIVDITYTCNKFVGYYDANLDTLACFICHPEFTVGYWLDTRRFFRGWSITPLELLCEVWLMKIIGLFCHLRDNPTDEDRVHPAGPYLLIPFGDNSSVPRCIHKTFAKSMGMDLVMDLHRRVRRDFNIEVQSFTPRAAIPRWITTNNNMPVDAAPPLPCVP